MGQQQLLLLILVMVLIGIALIIGIRYMNEKREESEMNNIAWQLQDSAQNAYRYFKIPLSLGGAGQDFAKTLQDSTVWLPPIMYAQDIEVNHEGSSNEVLIFAASTLDGDNRATLTLNANGNMDLVWEELD